MKTRLTTLMVILAAVASALAPGAAKAHGTAVPYHETGPIGCGAGAVNAYPPRVMRSWQYLPDYRKVERVHWSPDLYKYTTAGWQLVDASKPWFRAFTTSIGYYQAPFAGVWTNTQTNSGQVVFVPYRYLSPGYYAVKNHMYWDYPGLNHAQFGHYCYVS